MRIHVRLFSRFRDRYPPEARGEATIELPEGATVAQLLAHVGTEKRVKLITVNGMQVTDRQLTLHDGDSVRVFPIAVGG